MVRTLKLKGWNRKGRNQIVVRFVTVVQAADLGHQRHAQNAERYTFLMLGPRIYNEIPTRWLCALWSNDESTWVKESPEQIVAMIREASK